MENVNLCYVNDSLGLRLGRVMGEKEKLKINLFKINDKNCCKNSTKPKISILFYAKLMDVL
jgi:hypothetical protein